MAGLDLVVIADDLSGAAESAGALLMRTSRSTVVLAPSGAPTRPADAALTIDTNSRGLAAADAARVVREVATSLKAATVVVKKVDSLLRGNVAAEVAALADELDRTPVIAVSLPALSRTVRDGVLHVDGTPLHRTALWHVERGSAPRSVSAALAPMQTTLIDQEVVTAGVAAVTAALRVADAGELVPVCDAQSDADLDVIAEATCTVWARPLLVGSAALVHAAARHVLHVVPEQAGLPSGHRPGSLLIAVGSKAPSIGTQLDRLASSAAYVKLLSPDQLLSGTTAPLHEIDAAGVVVLAIDPRSPVDPSASAALVDAFADVVASVAPRFGGLVLTGGETARSVLDRLGVEELTVRAELGPGTVLSSAPSGQVVVTRPGSFGDADSLIRVAELLAGGTTKEKLMTALPRIAVTMGDGAGIGPEIIVRALEDPVVATLARVVVVGDALRLRQAAQLLGSAVDIVTVDTVEEAQQVPGRINVIDLALLPEDLPWGELSPVAGNAAYHYIRVASELAVAGQVEAICTAPLNKEALHAGGHLFPGHTEMLAKLTGTPEVSMMLSTERIKVIHVTTHIGLVDAVAKIEPGLVERVIRRGHKALVDAGVANPKIGVCGINPHAGENGLFGQGEEEAKINPAVEACRADGIDVHGALPADTLFFLAGRGDYDLVVAMYHDQGHGPVKVLGLEAGVNVTVGLPVIRTSVDHGTAFDIAGKGIADHRSMIEALRLAAEMAPHPADA